MRAVAALAVGSHQQPLFAERKAVDRIDVVGVNAGQAVFARHAIVAMALAAGLGHVERIDGRTRVGLGKDFVRIAVAARARMFLAIGVHAAAELGRLVGVAGLAIHRRDFVGMRIALDVRVAIRALQAAVNTVAEMLPVDKDAVAVAVGHARVAVAGEAVLCAEVPRRERQNRQAGHQRKAANHQNCVLSCGFVHSAVFLPWGERGRARSLAVPCRLHRSHNDCGGSHYKGRSLRRALAVIGVTGRAIQITRAGATSAFSGGKSQKSGFAAHVETSRLLPSVIQKSIETTGRGER
jgi:hypothetical protein